MKKEIEPGLEHIKKLHISAFRDGRAVYNEFSRKYGQRKSHEIVDSIFEAAGQSQQELYEKKNSDYDIAMIFTGGYDADIVRRSCNWIFEHKDSFGDEILEVGCDCGFMTTFLGTLFPEKHITAVERSKSGIEIAKRNVEKFGLTNVDFICDDIINLKDMKFDTVFSMRTLQENGDDVDESGLKELKELAEKYTKAKEKYASTIVSLVKEGGTLVSIERIGINALFLAWLQDLMNNGMMFNDYAQIKCREVGDEETFQALVFINNKTDNNDNAYDVFINCFAENLEQDRAEYFNWDAKILNDYFGGEMIMGYEATDKRNNAKSVVTVKKHNAESNCILLYNNNNGDAHLWIVGIFDLEEVIETVNNSLQETKKNDYIEIKEL